MQTDTKNKYKVISFPLYANIHFVYMERLQFNYNVMIKCSLEITGEIRGLVV